MEETESPAATPISRTRLVIGYFVIACGLAIVLRGLWLGANYWSEFDATETGYFIFGLWFGTWLALAGYAVTYRKRAAMCALSIIQALGLIAVVAYKFYFR